MEERSEINNLAATSKKLEKEKTFPPPNKQNKESNEEQKSLNPENNRKSMKIDTLKDQQNG